MKKIIAVILVLTTLLGLCACGGKDTAVAVDGEALSRELMAGSAFSQKLEELPSGKAEVFYGISADQLKSAVMYHAAGISKEQLAVFEAVDEETARAMAAALQSLLADWIESDRDYAPEEVPKMEKAVLRQSSVYVILVVANDPEAASGSVDKYL